MDLQYNILCRKKNKGWQYIISYKINRKWNQKSKQGFDTKTKAKAAADIALDKLKEEFRNNGSIIENDISFVELKELYYNEKKYYLAASSIMNMEMALKAFDFLSTYNIKDIVKEDIQKGITAMIKKGNKPRTIKSYVDYIKILFNYAIDKDILIKNPTKGVIIPKNRKESSRRALSREELEGLLTSLKNARGKNAPYYYLASLLAATCGLRIGEILGLNYNDFDFENKTVIINKQYSRFDSKGITDPKSENSNRVLTVPDNTLKEVKNLMIINSAGAEDMIFNLKSIDSFDKMINNRYKMLGYDICIHELRHTYATNLISNGVDLKTTAFLLGHDIKMTMQVYSHVNNEMLMNANKVIAEKMNI